MPALIHPPYRSEPAGTAYGRRFEELLLLAAARVSAGLTAVWKRQRKHCNLAFWCFDALFSEGEETVIYLPTISSLGLD